MIDLLKTNGTWYKANLYSYTTLSDGKMTPQQLKCHINLRYEDPLCPKEWIVSLLQFD